jgi:hypothetical protein
MALRFWTLGDVNHPQSPGVSGKSIIASRIKARPQVWRRRFSAVLRAAEGAEPNRFSLGMRLVIVAYACL